MKNFGIIDRWIWETNRWDGPIEGIAILDGREYFLDMCEEDQNRNRAFCVYDPPWWWWKIMKVNKKLFEKYVGLHTTYDEYGFRLQGGKWKDTGEDIWYYFNHLKTEILLRQEWMVGTCFEFEPNI